MWYSSALNFAAAGAHAQAAWRLARSLVTYPLPYAASDIAVPFGRTKSLAVQILRCARLKAPVPAPRPFFEDHRSDALEPWRERLRGQFPVRGMEVA